ncbi:hypothetical protein Scep_026725 [Stephania cephalantha]|uniref:Uncharacterized protein n=1 Tax=Stephania cephalantha TaxID=152367 RepID=A0AAP0EKQ0_9MAGN
MVTVYLRYERVRAGRQGPRPKSDVFHGRPSIFSSTREQPVARDRVRVSVRCRDRNNDLVMHRDKDIDMFHLDWDFNVPVWAYGQPGTAEPETYSCYCHVRWYVLCLEVSDEPSPSRRSPALQSKMGVWPWESMALGRENVRKRRERERKLEREKSPGKKEIQRRLGRLVGAIAAITQGRGGGGRTRPPGQAAESRHGARALQARRRRRTVAWRRERGGGFRFGGGGADLQASKRRRGRWQCGRTSDERRSQRRTASRRANAPAAMRRAPARDDAGERGGDG